MIEAARYGSATKGLIIRGLRLGYQMSGSLQEHLQESAHGVDVKGTTTKQELIVSRDVPRFLPIHLASPPSPGGMQVLRHTVPTPHLLFRSYHVYVDPRQQPLVAQKPSTHPGNWDRTSTAEDLIGFEEASPRFGHEGSLLEQVTLPPSTHSPTQL